MIDAAHYLKAAWVLQQFALALPLLPAGASLALRLGSKLTASVGEAGDSLTEDMAGCSSFPILLEEERVGVLLITPAGEATRHCGPLLAHALQGMLQSEHARRAVARETIESYREMAMLQRAVIEFNHLLKPAAVAAALLREFDKLKPGADHGAIFLYDEAEEGRLELIQCVGDGAADIFSRLQAGSLFVDMVSHATGDIANDLPNSPWWTPELAPLGALMWLPLNAHDERLGWLVVASRRTEGFSAADMKRAQVLVSVAATALRNAQLYAAEQRLFQSFVQVIATAIDAKSPYTAGHCRRVPEIALMIAEAAHMAESGPFADFVLDDAGRNALEIAAMLHDCGKVVTPEWIIDKAFKLDAIVNRIDLVALRFELLQRDAELDLHRALAQDADRDAARQVYLERVRHLDDDFAFLDKCNRGTEFITDEQLARIRTIACRTWRDSHGATLPLLTENEVYNLSTQRGTLNPEERRIIEDHVVHTINMLSQIAFPRPLRKVVEYAGGHHERMDGRGYPNGLTAAQLSIPARILAIADVFEALTAPDRPYRKPGNLDWVLDIMQRQKLDGHIDGDLFDLFLSERIHLDYAEKHLAARGK
ncbi:MAG: hypothetical protein H6R10_2683 [Rhodocyclaceae bacterium]|nr:hypothetical protein [Rhodocyclaceae bacterium]